MLNERTEKPTLLTMDDAVFQRLQTDMHYADQRRERRERFDDSGGSPRSAEDVLRAAAARWRKKLGDTEHWDADHCPFEGGGE